MDLSVFVYIVVLQRNTVEWRNGDDRIVVATDYFGINCSSKHSPNHSHATLMIVNKQAIVAVKNTFRLN